MVLADRAAEEVGAAAQDLAKEGLKCIAVGLDVTDQKATATVIEGVVSRYGPLDLVINSAGTAVMGEMKDIPLDEWKRIIDVNLWGAIHVTDAAYKAMIPHGRGHIVNIASAAGIVPSTMRIPYTTAKHGVVGLSTSLRAEAEAYGIKVSVVCPGVVKTGIFKKVRVYGGSPNLVEVQASKYPAPSAEDAAACILRAVAQNRAIIPVTRDSQVVWRLYRYMPWLYRLFLRQITAEYRSLLRVEATER